MCSIPGAATTASTIWRSAGSLTSASSLPKSPEQRKRAFGLAQLPIERATRHAAEEADIIFRLARLFRPRLVARHLSTVYETLERPLVPVLARMERRGIAIDRQILSRLSG